MSAEVARLERALATGKAPGPLSSNARGQARNEPIGKHRVVPDFLPPPDQLAFRDEGVKVTIVLSKRSIEFFKAHAARSQTQYQRMIRQLLDAYVDAYAKPPATRSSGRAVPSASRSGRRST